MSKSEEEAVMQYAIAAHLGEKNIVIPNISFARISCRVPKYGNNGQLIGHEYPFKGVRHEADLIWINDNDYDFLENVTGEQREELEKEINKVVQRWLDKYELRDYGFLVENVEMVKV